MSKRIEQSLRERERSTVNFIHRADRITAATRCGSSVSNQDKN